MKKFLSLILLLFTAALTAAVAQVDFTVSYKRVNPTTIDIVFTGTAQPGWHIYSTADLRPPRSAWTTSRAQSLKAS